MSKALATKNVAAALVAVSLVFGFAFAFATPAKADVLSDLQAQVQALLAQIAALQGGSTSTGACFTFTQNLKQGSTGSEVMQAQKFLNSKGFTIAATGAGSPGNETSYFGGLTKAAVIKFQNANAATILTPVGLTAGTGNWFAGTRAAANAMCTGGSTGGPVIPTGPGLTVMASTQPTNSLAPGSASRVPFTTFTLTNNTGSAVTINGITVQRTGLAIDGVFTGVVLVDSNGAQIGVAHTFNSNHQTNVGDTFTINAGQTMTLTVAGNMQTAATLANYAGQVAGISVIGINTSVPVNGVLPISGAMQTINASLSIGSVTASVSSFDPDSAQTKNIGDTGIKFSGIRLQAGSAEDVKLFSVRWRLNGSASQGDISNIVTVVNGTSYPTTVSADGRYYTAVFPGGLLIQKGFSADAYIQGDLLGTNAANRVVEFDIDKTSDVYVVGQTYGYGIIPSATPTDSLSTDSTHGSNLNNSNQPWLQGSTITIQGGTVTTISNATEVAAQNIAVNVPNQPLGGFATNFLGEPVTVQNLIFHFATSSSPTCTSNCLLLNVSLVDENGSVVAGPADASLYSGGAEQVVSFSNAVTFPTGRHIYTLKGTIPSGVGNGATFTAQTNPSVTTDGGDGYWSNIMGQNTGNTVSLSGVGSFNMNPMTVRTASLTMTLSTSPSAQTIVKGSQGVIFANVQLDATQSGEDVRINGVPLHVDQAFVAAGSSVSGLSSCQLFDSGGNSLNNGSNIVNSFTNDATTTAATTYTKAFTLNNSLVIAKGVLVTLVLKCNVSSSATSNDSYRFKVYSGDTLTFTGVTSGGSSSATISSSQSGRQTIASNGSITVSNDASSPSVALAAGGSSGIVVGVAKFRPANEAVNLTKIGLTLTNGTYQGPTGAQDLVTVYLYKGATLLGSAVFAGNATTATSSLLSSLNLPKDTDTAITIKGDLADIGASMSGTEGDRIKIDVANFEGTGVGSGATITGGAQAGLTTLQGVYLFNTFPTFAQGTGIGGTGSVAAGKLLRFSVTADSHGDVGINKFAFTIATSSSVTISGLNLYGYTDSSYSTPISGQQSGGALLSSSVTATSTSVIPIVPSSAPVEVPAGQTYYFELRGSTGGYTSGSSITTTLLGDTTTPASMAAAASVAANFVWSPNATTTTVATVADWTNGANVIGLPAGGIIQTVTQ